MTVTPTPGPLAPDLPSGLFDALSNRFAVERELGRGGMGSVLLAHDRSLDRPVAIKVLTPEFSRVLGAERFAREIRLTARLVHPNIVPLFDSGQASECLYYVMPFIDGDTLRHRVRQGRLPVPEVLRIVGDLAEALAYAHALGIVHRDLKPDNVFWYGGRALLADFGIATTTDRMDGIRTGTGMIVGTVAYMSPEQASGERGLDGRSDLYSLGCVAFELLIGLPPFTGANVMAVVAAHISTPAPEIRSSRPEVPQEFSDVIHRLLEKDPGDRFSSAASLIQALRTSQSVDTPPSMPVPAEMQGKVPPAIRATYEEANSLFHRAVQGGEGALAKLEMAKVYLEKALARVPDEPHVLVTLADTEAVLGIRGFVDFGEAQKRAHALRIRALAADDTVGEVHTSLGVQFLYWDDDFETGGSELRRGAELAPHHPNGRRLYGAWLKIAGRASEALEEMRAAVKLEPKAPFMYVGLADVLMALGRYGEAVDPLREALRLLPRYDAALERLEMSLHRAGRHPDAHDARRMLLGMRGGADRIAMLDRDVAEQGWVVARDHDLRRDLDALMKEAETEDPFLDRRGSRQLSDKIIIVLAELGEWNKAMDWVEKGYHRRPGRLRRVLTDLPYDYHGLASDPRFVRLLRTAGLTDLL
jgi:tetratricopeptide (TPR) repeat protein